MASNYSDGQGNFSSNVVCDHFLRNSCRYGQACWKIHPSKTTLLKNNNRVITEQKDNQNQRKYKSVDNTMKRSIGEHHDQKKMIICKHFQNGTCAFGTSCYRLHVVEDTNHLHKSPYNLNSDVQNATKFKPPMNRLFFTDSKPEEHIQIPSIQLKKHRRRIKKEMAPPSNLFEVLDNESSNESFSEDNRKETENLLFHLDSKAEIKENDLSNVEKKKIKKVTKKRQMEIETLKKVDALKESGNLEFHAGRYSSAAKDYTKAISLAGPNKPASSVYNSRCAAFIMLEKFDFALKDGRKVVELDPDNSTVFHRLVRCCVALGKIEEGKRYLLTIIDDSDPNVETMGKTLDTIGRLHNEALEQENKLDFNSALKTISQVLEISPYSSHFLILKAKFMSLTKDIVGAKKTLSMLILKEQNVQSSLYHFVTGICCYYEDEMLMAISGFGQARKELPEAEEWYDKAMTMHNAFICGNKGVKMGNSYFSDLASIDRGLGIDKENTAYMVKMFYTRALLNTKYKKLDAALTDCTCAIQHDPGYYKAWCKRGSLQLDLAKYIDAVADLTEAYRLKRTLENHLALEDAKNRKNKAEEDAKRRRNKAGEEAKRRNTKAEENDKRRKIKEEEDAKKRNDQADKRKLSHYQILGVDMKATTAEIKKAYRSKAREFHPDKHANASKEEQDVMEAKMKQIAAANQCLSDPTKKVDYDRNLGNMLRNENSDIEDYDNEDDDGFSFDRDDFFFHLFGFYTRGGGSFYGRNFRR